MEITRFQCDGHFIFQEPLDSGTDLEVELEISAQIGMPDACCRHTYSGVKKWDPTRARSEVVSQMGRQSHEPLTVGRELRRCDQFQSEFEIASIPMTLARGVAEHVTIRKANQTQVMRLDTAKGRNTVRRAGTETDVAGGGSKSFANTFLPNVFGNC